MDSGIYKSIEKVIEERMIIKKEDLQKYFYKGTSKLKSNKNKIVFK